MRPYGQFNKGIDARRSDTGLRRAEPGRPGRLGVRPLAARVLTALLLAVFAALLALPAQAQGLTTFVSNTHISDLRTAGLFIAQSFETGANPDGYTISNVQIMLHASSNPSALTSAKIREYNASDEPGDLVATLTNPGTLVSDSLNTFTAPAGTTLDANTTYFIMLNEGISSSNKVIFATSFSDDQTGEPGWSIGDSRLNRLSSTGDWTASGSSILIAIKRHCWHPYQQPRDGRAGDHWRGGAGPDAVGGDHGDFGRRRHDEGRRRRRGLRIHLPVGAGGRGRLVEPGGHSGRDGQHLHGNLGGCRQSDSGEG